MHQEQAGSTDRRGFFKKSFALAFAGIAALVPVAAGLRVLLDPLRRKGPGPSLIKVTTLDALPDDGQPRRFPVIAARTDAWNRFDAASIGAVYLRRTPDGKVEALNVNCPHAGCGVDFSDSDRMFHCPCHKSSFALNGRIAGASSPSPRALDALVTKVDDAGAVWVEFQNFQPGRPDKVPVT